MSKEIIINGPCILVRQVTNGWVTTMLSANADENAIEQVFTDPLALGEHIAAWAGEQHEAMLPSNEYGNENEANQSIQEDLPMPARKRINN